MGIYYHLFIIIYYHFSDPTTCIPCSGTPSTTLTEQKLHDPNL